MKDYKIYFIAWGRKLKITISANSETEAMHMLRNQIEILKVEESNMYDSDIAWFFDGIFK